MPKDHLKFWRVVYVSTIGPGGPMHRGPAAEMVVEAPTLEAALRLVAQSERAEVKIRYEAVGVIVFTRVEPATEEDHYQANCDAMAAMGPHIGPAASAQEARARTQAYEHRLAEMRRARKIKRLQTGK